MKAIAHEVLDHRDVLRFVERHFFDTDTPSNRTRVPHDAVGLRRPPALRRAAYLAALDGELWRPYV